VRAHAAELAVPCVGTAVDSAATSVTPDHTP